MRTAIYKIPKTILHPRSVDQIDEYLRVKSWYSLLFKKYQKFLVEICNNPIIQEELGIPVFSKVLAVNPAGYSIFDYWVDKNKGLAKCHAIVASWDKLGFQLQSYLRTLEAIEGIVVKDFDAGREAFTLFRKNPTIMAQSFLFATYTADASTGSNGIRVTAASSWNNARTHGDGSRELSIFILQDTEAGSLYSCGRYYGFFDLTTVVPTGSTIDDGTKLIHPPVGNVTFNHADTMYIVNHTNTDPVPNSDASFTNSIGNNQKTWGSLAFASLSTSVAVDINLTSTGRANVTPNAINKLGLRSGRDIDNSAPNDYEQYTANPAAFDFYVTFTAPVVSGGNPIMFEGGGLALG